jgi:hypothetical protein
LHFEGKNLAQQIQDRNKNKSFESHAQSSRKFLPTTAIQVSTKYIVFIVFYDLKKKIKSNKYLRIFIINHKNAINIIYPDIQLGRCGEQRFVKIFTPPLSSSHEEFSRRLRVTFK